MANVLSPRKQALIIFCLVEGMSLRATARLTDTHRTTILNLLRDAGTWAAECCDRMLRDLLCKRLGVGRDLELCVCKGRKSGEGDLRAA